MSDNLTITNQKTSFDANTNADIPARTTATSGGKHVQHVAQNDAASAATLSNVSGSASSVSLLASNSARRGTLVFNDSTAALKLKYGATASASSFSVKIAAGSYWEMPQPIYTGAIDGIWDAADGAARITELTGYAAV